MYLEKHFESSTYSKMLKLSFSVLICAIIILADEDENSITQRSKSFFGPCPAAPLNSSSSVSIDDILGTWFTHFVIEPSPWKGFSCHSIHISKKSGQNASVETRFDFPSWEISKELNGTVETINSSSAKFLFNFTVADGSAALPILTEVLRLHKEGACLVWTCLDYTAFHIENLAVLTIYQDPNDKRIDPSVYDDINKAIEEAKFGPDDKTPIPQTNCL